MKETTPPGMGSDEWLRSLRRRLVELARRRVGVDDVEDVVQAALRVIAERGLDGKSSDVDGLPPLAWCFQVLRNTIGNHYKRERTRRARVDSEAGLELVEDPRADVLRVLALERTLEELRGKDEQCAALLEGAMEGLSAEELARDRGLPINALYQRLYRCRRRFREMLRERGILT